MTDVRNMLKKLGAGESGANLATPFIFFLPRTSDPYAQGIHVIVQGLQKGVGVKPDGWLGADTAAKIRKIAGEGWRDMTWAQLYEKVIDYRERKTTSLRSTLGADLDTAKQSSFGTILALGAGAFVVYALFSSSSKKGYGR